MKIDQLRLIAYGPFSNVELDFSRDAARFHLIYGANEAGKSSALRGLRSLLFGIPVRTPDSFRHTHPKLRIGAHLTHSDGRTIAFVRRKGRSKTLRGPDDRELLADDALAPFLGGIDRGFFEQMFAIGHEDLVQGGEEIISGGGSVGQALFAAGAGLVRLQTFRQRLQEDCESLFKPSGSRPRINRSLTSLRAARKHQKAALLQAKTWKTHHQALRDAAERREAVQQELLRLQQAYGLLQRIGEALPLMARKKEIDAAFPAYANVPRLSDDFGTRRLRVENEHEIAANDFKRSQERVGHLDEQIRRMNVPAQLIRHGAIVEALQHDLGSFKKAQKDRPTLEARMRILSRQAAASLSRAGGRQPDADDRIDLPPAIVGEIQELDKHHERLRIRMEAVQGQRRQLTTDIEALQEERRKLTTPHGLDTLKTALQTAQDAGPLEKLLAESQSAIAAQEDALNLDLQRQTLWTGKLEELDGLAFPSKERVDHFDERRKALTRRLENLMEEKRRQAEEASDIDTALTAMAIAHDLPSEERLAAARTLRDKGWLLVRRRLEGHDPASEEELAFQADIQAQSSLPDAFEKSLRRADRIVDRLRRDAEQIGRQSMLAARQKKNAQQQEEIDAAIETVRQAQSALETEWRQSWAPAGIAPLPPAEMRIWQNDMIALREKMAALRTAQHKTTLMRTEKQDLFSRLAKALAGAGRAKVAEDSLAGLIATARSYLASQEEIRNRISTIDQELLKQRHAQKALGAEIEDLGSQQREWQDAWGKQAVRIGLAPETSPAAGLALIEGIREANVQRDEAHVLQKRIRGIDRDADAFRQRVDDLTARLAPELKDEPHDRAALLLNVRLTEAREAQSNLKSLEQQLAEAREGMQSARKRVEDAQTLTQSLCREANCENPDALPDIENRAQQRQQIADERKDLENRLRQLGAGATVAAFMAQAEAIDTDRIAPEMERLKTVIQSREQERSDLDQTIGTERAELKRMDGRAVAAEYAEDAERQLADLEADVERYARSKIASVLLTRTIERYREKHQGPLIRRSSDLFAQMTAGAFDGVRAEYDEKGNPVLVGIRSGGSEQVAVAGLSDGTADQLYLALRLASIEQYLDASEPLPFVVDDILLRFDDERSRGTLEILAGLAARIQVIFFTHHQHMVDLARQSVDAKVLQVHRL